MLADYQDIKSRIAEEPLWYDSNGVPRYDYFSPDMCPNIYAREVILFLIECQYCGKRLHVEEHYSSWDTKSIKGRLLDWLDGEMWEVRYGDPPRHDCIGDTMSSDEIRILEYWSRIDGDWVRESQWEISLEDDHE